MKKILMISNITIAAQTLTERIRRTAKERALDIDIMLLSEAEGIQHAREHVGEFDMILLAPNLRYLLNVSDVLRGRNTPPPVVVIESVNFGNLDVSAVMEQILLHI